MDASVPVESDHQSVATKSYVADFVPLIRENLRFVLQRMGPAHGNGLVDTKYDIINARDFDEFGTIRSKEVVYGWIQGRALEALAGHAVWFQESKEPMGEDTVPLDTIRLALEGLVERLETIRLSQGGRLAFLMNSSGQPLEVGQDGQLRPRNGLKEVARSYTDIFYAKGLFAATRYLGDLPRMKIAQGIFDEAVEVIQASRFRSDQLALDPANSSLKTAAKRRTQATRMIALSGLPLFLEGTHDSRYLTLGLEFIRDVLDDYVNTEGQLDIPHCAMWEYTTMNGEPYFEGDCLPSLPGHAIEFAGLSLKFIRNCERYFDGQFREVISQFKRLLPQVFLTAFRLGWHPQGYGIYQSVDIVSGKPIYTQLPWWNLPEVIRAASECILVVPKEERADYFSVIDKCTKAFFEYYVKPPHLLAVQALDNSGKPDRSIPAVPDVDPCYHTGLSLIDSMKCFSAL